MYVVVQPRMDIGRTLPVCNMLVVHTLFDTAADCNISVDFFSCSVEEPRERELEGLDLGEG